MTALSEPDLRTDFHAPARSGLLFAGGAFALTLILLSVIRISGAVTASGAVEGEARPAPIQSVEGGRVSRLFVEEGQRVAAGDPILRLDASALETEVAVLAARLEDAALRETRLDAEYRGSDTGLGGTGAQGEIEILAARREVHESRLAALDEMAEQLATQKRGVAQSIDLLRERLTLAEEHLATAERLAEKGLVVRKQLLDARAAQMDIAARLAERETEAGRLQSQIAEAAHQRAEAERSFREVAVTDLKTAADDRQELELRLAEARERLARLTLVAPREGIVHNLSVAAEGTVVPAGAAVAEVVPTGANARFALSLSPIDVDDVSVGQEARLLFPGFNARTTPEIEGRVDRVAAAASVDPVTKAAVYRVEVTASPDQVARLGSVEFRPGMPVEARLTTEPRSVLSYLVRPLTDHLTGAFREP